METHTASLAEEVSSDLYRSREGLVAEWLMELQTFPRIRPRKEFPADALREQMPRVIEWVAAHLRTTGEGPGDTDALRELARFRRSQTYSISEVLQELDLLDHLLYRRLQTVVATRGSRDPAGEVAALAERLHTGLVSLRTILVGTFEEEAEQHARELSDRLNTFVRTLSHELKNPIGAAAGGAAMLQEEGVRKDENSLTKFSALITRNLGRAQALISDLRSLVLPTEDSASAPQVALRSVLDDVLHEVHAAADEKGVTVRIEEPVPDVEVDARRVTLILMNLVWNAIRYSDPGKPDRWVRVLIERDGTGSAWRIDVSDNGLGIPADARERIFERFFRAHHDVQGGTGLGLAIVAEAVEQMGGRIWVESKEGEGTTFSFTLGPSASDSAEPGRDTQG
jgi:signal transduction histidine kinase